MLTALEITNDYSQFIATQCVILWYPKYFFYTSDSLRLFVSFISIRCLKKKLFSKFAVFKKQLQPALNSRTLYQGQWPLAEMCIHTCGSCLSSLVKFNDVSAKISLHDVFFIQYYSIRFARSASEPYLGPFTILISFKFRWHNLRHVIKITY